MSTRTQRFPFEGRAAFREIPGTPGIHLMQERGPRLQRHRVNIPESPESRGCELSLEGV